MAEPKIISIQKMVMAGELQKWLSDNLGIYRCRRTIHNWTYRGKNGKTLKTIMIGNKRLTCEEWIMEFLEGVKC